MALIEDEQPLQASYRPNEITERTETLEDIKSALTTGSNIHIQGPHGTGKTHSVQTVAEDHDDRVCYISCLDHDTEYQVLKKLLEELTKSPMSTGHHTSDLHRELVDELVVRDLVVILDDVGFLLLNDGEDLLYALSRMENSPQLLTISTGTEQLQEQIEARTYSSLRPHHIHFEPYSGEQVYELLAARATESLQPRSIHRNALSYIASTTRNMKAALTWLRTAADTADDKITENIMQMVEKDAAQIHAENQLEPLTAHHKYLYRAISELSEQRESVLNAGEIYQCYESTVEERKDKLLSNRRISDFLKHLEQLGIISADYHYGGVEGKTRKIQLQHFTE